MSLLSLVPLKSSTRWVFLATASVVLALATFGSGLIVLEVDQDWALRLVGVLGVLDGCGTVLVPVIFKLSDHPSKDRKPNPHFSQPKRSKPPFAA